MHAIAPFPPAHSLANPTLADFARDWFDQVSIGWREATTRRVASILRCHLLPVIEQFPIDGFGRRDLMVLRADLARGRGAAATACSPIRVNAVVQVLGQLLTEREQQLGIANPCANLRRLPTRKPSITPFTLPELRQLVEAAPEHLRDYVWVRGIMGLRSGEANGLRWDCVDFNAGTMDIRRARSDGADRLPKNQYSERLLRLTPSVLEALRRQQSRTGSADGYVFQTRRGLPIDIQNFARRDWRYMLGKAGLTQRVPEQLRHTAATLMLAAGEAPTYVAQVLGHADCRMLLTNYARYMPGALGRTDGLALERELSRNEASMLVG